jgi:hypothetical protein
VETRPAKSRKAPLKFDVKKFGEKKKISNGNEEAAEASRRGKGKKKNGENKKWREMTHTGEKGDIHALIGATSRHFCSANGERESHPGNEKSAWKVEIGEIGERDVRGTGGVPMTKSRRTSAVRSPSYIRTCPLLTTLHNLTRRNEN